jgi:hypothetical protein
MSEPPVATAPVGAPPDDEATAAAEQMLAATEKLRARLPMMQGDPVPDQPTES